jgi:hypothetical protein
LLKLLLFFLQKMIITLWGFFWRKTSFFRRKSAKIVITTSNSCRSLSSEIESSKWLHRKPFVAKVAARKKKFLFFNNQQKLALPRHFFVCSASSEQKSWRNNNVSLFDLQAELRPAAPKCQWHRRTPNSLIIFGLKIVAVKSTAPRIR